MTSLLNLKRQWPNVWPWTLNHGHPYILSTTVLCDRQFLVALLFADLPSVSPFISFLYLCNLISGSEYGIVLLSTVRSRQITEDGDEVDIRKILGFVADPHRICVGITRSKYGLVIVGKHGL